MSDEILEVKLENLEKNTKEKISDILERLGKKADLVIVLDNREDITKLKDNFARVGWTLGTAVIIGILTLLFKDGLI